MSFDSKPRPGQKAGEISAISTRRSAEGGVGGSTGGSSRIGDYVYWTEYSFVAPKYLYIDNAYERRKRAGKIRDLNDIIWAHMEGTVMRVRPKLMTVSTMLIGLLPLLWASGSGSDVMKRIATPMVGGLITSAFLTLEIIPVVYTYWRQEQLLWELLPAHDRRRLGRLKLPANVHGAGWFVLTSLLVALIYMEVPAAWRLAGFVSSGVTIALSALVYVLLRPEARRLVWPAPRARAEALG